MGYFSFLSCKTGESIPVDSNVVLVHPNNDPIFGFYDGYGRIKYAEESVYANHEGIIDVHTFLAFINDIQLDTEEDTRMRGITMFLDEDPKFKLKIMKSNEYEKTDKYEDLKESLSCPNQGFFY